MSSMSGSSRKGLQRAETAHCGLRGHTLQLLLPAAGPALALAHSAAFSPRLMVCEGADNKQHNCIEVHLCCCHTMVDLAPTLVHSQEGPPDADFVQLAVLLGLDLQICRWRTRGISGVGMGKETGLPWTCCIQAAPCICTHGLTGPHRERATARQAAGTRDWLAERHRAWQLTCVHLMHASENRCGTH